MRDGTNEGINSLPRCDFLGIWCETESFLQGLLTSHSKQVGNAEPRLEVESYRPCPYPSSHILLPSICVHLRHLILSLLVPPSQIYILDNDDTESFKLGLVLLVVILGNTLLDFTQRQKAERVSGSRPDYLFVHALPLRHFAFVGVLAW